MSGFLDLRKIIPGQRRIRQAWRDSTCPRCLQPIQEGANIEQEHGEDIHYGCRDAGEYEEG